MRRNVALKKLRQAEADDLFWFYSYAQDNHLSLTDAGDALGVSGTDAWNIMMGRFPDYAQAVSMIRAKRRSAKGSEAEATGFVETSTAHGQPGMRLCRGVPEAGVHLRRIADREDGMPGAMEGHAQHRVCEGVRDPSGPAGLCRV